MARKVVLRYLLVLAVLGVVVIPFLWIVLGSLRPNSELIKPGAQFDVGRCRSTTTRTSARRPTTAPS